MMMTERLLSGYSQFDSSISSPFHAYCTGKENELRKGDRVSPVHWRWKSVGLLFSPSRSAHQESIIGPISRIEDSIGMNEISLIPIPTAVDSFNLAHRHEPGILHLIQLSASGNEPIPTSNSSFKRATSVFTVTLKHILVLVLTCSLWFIAAIWKPLDYSLICFYLHVKINDSL